MPGEFHRGLDGSRSSGLNRRRLSATTLLGYVKSLTFPRPPPMVAVHPRPAPTPTTISPARPGRRTPMARPVTLFTGQWGRPTTNSKSSARRPSSGATTGSSSPAGATTSTSRKPSRMTIIARPPARPPRQVRPQRWAISNHLTVDRLVLDVLDSRTDDWASRPRSRATSKKKQAWAIQEMKDTARARPEARRLDRPTASTGSSIWHLLYSFPPVCQDRRSRRVQAPGREVEPDPRRLQGVRRPVRAGGPPDGIAFDLYSAKTALEALNNRPEFGFNFDPSHLLGAVRRPGRLLP